MPRGGARPGAGRKAAIPGSVEVKWRVSAEARDWLKTQSQELGEPIAKILDHLIESYETSCGQ